MNKKQISVVIAAVIFSTNVVAAGNDWSGILSVSLGNDDNVTLGDDSNVQASNEGDNFLDILATAGTYLTGNRDAGFRVNGTFYNREYDTEDGFNFTLVAASIAYHKKLGSWHGRFGAKYSYIEFGGEPYESVYDLTAEGRHKFSKTTEIRIRYRYSDINAESTQFNNLEGDRHQLRIEGRLKAGGNRYRLSYRYETNDRNDTETLTTYTSSSPVRHTIRVNAKIPLSGKWGSEIDMRWRDSRYKDDNVTLISSVRRKDDRFKAKLGLNYEYNRNIELYADYTYTDNDSNIDSNEYVRNTISMGVNYLF